MRDILETALDAIRINRLRSILTILIIAVGITSLVGIQTAIEVLSREVSDSFGRMGAAKITITAAEKAPPLTVSQAESFTAAYSSGTASASLTVNPIARATCEGRSTDPVITLTASDAGWLACSGMELSAGRNFTSREAQEGAAVCIIGSFIAKKITGDEKPEAALGREVSFGRGTYRIIGVTSRRGASLTPGGNCEAVIPLHNAINSLVGGEAGCTITCITGGGQAAGGSEAEISSLMRRARRLQPGADDDFTIRSGDSLEEMMDSIKAKLSGAALAIGLITLLGAAVGLMNIMLVSVRERRSEIGLRKALGARNSQIARQFLFEAFLICQAGGAIGTILGIGAGNIVASLLESTALMPFKWIGIAILTCAAVSLLAGLIPALRASEMNPAEALGCE